MQALASYNGPMVHVNHSHRLAQPGRETTSTGVSALKLIPIRVLASPNEMYRINDEYYLEKLDSSFHGRLQRLQAPTMHDFLTWFNAFEEEFFDDMGPLGDMYRVSLDDMKLKPRRIAIAIDRYTQRS